MQRCALYLHIPYCHAKCPYCDFNSHAAQQWPEARYVETLCRELEHYTRQPPWIEAQIQTIFFGGGTPSLFAPASIGAILDAVAKHWALATDVETTLEANPGTISADKLTGFRHAGIDRMSFGVQSFAPHHLRTLGRIHSAQDAVEAIRSARAAGFDNVSLDLIFALPHQTPPEWESDLAQACALEPDHLSAYNLTYEEGTPFHQWRAQGKLHQLPEEIEVAMFTRTQEVLGASGYRQYEISNYAKPGRECRHNLNYWRSGDYLGVGAGAHSYTAATASVIDTSGPDEGSGASPASPGWGYRWSNEKSPSKYMQAVEAQGHARVTDERLDERQARGEFVFLGLRCLNGIEAAAFRARFGAEFSAAFPHCGDLRDGGLLRHDDGWWQLTQHGLLLADSVFTTFL